MCLKAVNCASDLAPKCSHKQRTKPDYMYRSHVFSSDSSPHRNPSLLPHWSSEVARLATGILCRSKSVVAPVIVAGMMMFVMPAITAAASVAHAPTTTTDVRSHPDSVAPAKALVSGTVVDENDKPIVRASVQLSDPTMGVTRYSDITSTEGRFEFENVKDGEYRLTTRHVSFRSAESTIVIQGGRAVEDVRIVLHSAMVPVGEVVVTDSRALVGVSPIAISNLTQREIERSSDMKDIPVLLSSTPSVSQYSENGNGLGYTYLRMRGFDQKRVAVSINGIPQNDPEAFDVFWINFFDLQGSIQDIQIQRGAGSSVFGSTGIGGAIDIVAMPYDPDRFVEARLGMGSYDTRRFTVSAASGRLGGGWSLFGRLSKMQSDGYRDWSWTDYLRYFVGVRHVGSRSVLTLQSYGGRQKDGLAYIGIPKEANDGAVDDGFGGTIERTSNYSLATRDVERFNQPHVELHHSLQVSPSINVDQSLFYIRGNGYFDFDGTYRSANYLRLPDGIVPDADRELPLYESLPGTTVLYRAALDQWHIGWLPRMSWTDEGGRSTVGGEVRLHRSTRWGRVQESNALPATVIGDADYRSYSVRGEKIVAGLYGRTERALSDAVTGLAEVAVNFSRYRVFEEAFFETEFEKPYVFVNPRVGITYAVNDVASLFSSVSYASREPRLKALYDGEEAGAGALPQFALNLDGSLDLDNPFVRPEHVVDVELGGSYQGNRTRAGVTLFAMLFKDEIVPSGGLDQFGIPRTGNAARTRHMGVELEGDVRVGRFVDAFGSATVSNHRFVRFTEFEYGDLGIVELERDGNPIAGFPDYMANAGVTLHGKGLSLSVSARYVGTQFVNNEGDLGLDGANEVDPHVLANANIRYDFGGRMAGLQASVDINNVFDANVLAFGNAGFGAPQFFPEATRNVFAGIRYRID